MSSSGVAFVLESSPYTGSTLLVHIALGDIANDLNRWEIWVAVGNLAERARVARKTATEALATMVSDGYLELLEVRPGAPTRYRFLRPQRVRPEDAPVIHTCNEGPQGVRPETAQTGNELEPSKGFTDSLARELEPVDKEQVREAIAEAKRRLPRGEQEITTGTATTSLAIDDHPYIDTTGKQKCDVCSFGAWLHVPLIVPAPSPEPPVGEDPSALMSPPGPASTSVPEHGEEGSAPA